MQFEDGKMAALDGSDDNAIMVARLQHEKAGRMELLKQLDALRARKVRGTLDSILTRAESTYALYDLVRCPLIGSRASDPGP